MSNYVVTTDFAAKDALATGNPLKVASGTQVDAELDNIATAIATKEDTANKGQNSGYASLDSSGDVPDTQIPATIPRLATNPIFSGSLTGLVGTVGLAAAVPGIVYNETDAAVDNKYWREYINAGVWTLGIINDAGSVTAEPIKVTRSGTTATSIALVATATTINGSTVWHAGNDGAGSGLDADLLDGLSSAAFAATSHVHSAADITSGILAVARGGTGTTTSTGTGNTVLSASPTFTGTVTAAAISATTVAATLSGDGAGVTGLSAANVSAGTLAIARGGTGQTDGTTRNITGKAGVTKTLSTSVASGGSDGDIWYRY